MVSYTGQAYQRKNGYNTKTIDKEGHNSMIPSLFLPFIISSYAPAPVVIQPLKYKTQQIYRTSHALLVADDNPATGGEVAFGNSVKRLQVILERDCGFPKGNVTYLSSTQKTFTPTRLREEMAKLRDPKRVSTQDRVLIIFAVHGTVKQKEGFFQCNPDPKNQSGLLPMKEISTVVLTEEGGIPAKHVLMIADSCSAGVMVTEKPTKNLRSDNIIQRIKVPFRGIWAASDPNDVAIGDDSQQKTILLSRIAGALEYSTNYPERIATGESIFEGNAGVNQPQVKKSIGTFYEPSRGGSFVFGLKPTKLIEKDEDEAREAQRQADIHRAHKLTDGQRKQLEQAESESRNIDKEKEPEKWAEAKLAEGYAFQKVTYGYQGKNVREGMKCYQDALTIFTQKDFPQGWATTQNNLGTAWSNLPSGDIDANLKKAIECYQNALKIRTQKDFPELWAKTQNNLGVAWLSLPSGDIDANLKKAIEYFQNALPILTQKDFPELWAKTQSLLGSVWLSLPSGDRDVNLKKAIECYQNALKVRTQNDFPQDWARTQNSLGIAWANLPSGDRGANLKKAIEYFQNALPILTQKDFPELWAKTQSLLGNAWLSLPSGDRDVNLKKAIEYYQNALTIFTQKDFPALWATTQGNLGVAWANLPSGDRTANLKNAIECYQNALKVRTQNDFPWDFVETQFNLGLAYKDQKEIVKSRKCFELARDVAKQISRKEIQSLAEEELRNLK
jgi:tetratricopeptide (TPR) repeat protein